MECYNTHLGVGEVIIFVSVFLRICSCVGTVGTVTCHLNLILPFCVALGWVHIWGLNPDWWKSFVNWVSSLFPRGGFKPGT